MEGASEVGVKMNSMPKYVVSSTLEHPDWSRSMRANLIDLYRFMVHPIVLGAGARLFSEEGGRPTLTLAHHEAFATGIVNLEYVPARRS